MKYFIVAVRDRAADVFAQPMCVASKGTAVRSFMDEVNRSEPNNMLNKHPEDFDLYYLGLYDDSTASFELSDTPVQLAIGKDVIR